MSPLHQQFLDVAERHAVLHTTKEPTIATTSTTTVRPPTDRQPSYHSPVHKEFLAAAERHEAREIAKKLKKPAVDYFAAPSDTVYNCRMEMFKLIDQQETRKSFSRRKRTNLPAKTSSSSGSTNCAVKHAQMGGPSLVSSFFHYFSVFREDTCKRRHRLTNHHVQLLCCLAKQNSRASTTKGPYED